VQVPIGFFDSVLGTAGRLPRWGPCKKGSRLLNVRPALENTPPPVELWRIICKEGPRLS
jgi:hypothetical protein